MSDFTRPAILSFSKHVPAGCSILVYSFVFYVDWDDETDFVSVPALMVTDGLSCPSFIAWMFRKYDSRTLKAALIYDFLYRFNVIKSTVDVPRICTRKEADVIFYRAILLACRSSNARRLFSWKVRCMAAYYALRVFGGLAFKDR